MRTSLLILISFFCLTSQAQEQTFEFEVDFEGGSVADFMDTLMDLGINVVVPANAEGIQIPTIKLDNVTPDRLFDALSIIGAQAPTQFTWKSSGQSMPTILSEDGSVIAGPGKKIWVLEPYGSQKTAQPFALGHLLVSENNSEGYSVDEITSAIDATVQANAQAGGRNSDIEFQYHEGTELLIITGVINDVEVAEDTLKTLRESLQSRRTSETFGGLLDRLGATGLVQPDN
ncbi:MAG: hypothetical protein GKR91_09275 [Pseudomonadales bacterium]|nr:hypothetical protein [Pseudomonadales bacterium]